MTKNDTIIITQPIIDKLNEAIKIALDFEKLTGKQLNITSTVGEVLSSNNFKLKLIVNDTNESYDAIDKDEKKVQIKTRRHKGKNGALIGKLLDKNFKVSFDYAILFILNEDYTYKEHFRNEAGTIEKHFDRINERRIIEGKAKRKTMSISQFKGLSQQH